MAAKAVKAVVPSEMRAALERRLLADGAKRRRFAVFLWKSRRQHFSRQNAFVFM
jgi:hypothetical protein